MPSLHTRPPILAVLYRKAKCNLRSESTLEELRLMSLEALGTSFGQPSVLTAIDCAGVEEEEDYKLWPANKSDRSWQSLSNPAKRHSFVSN